jgi:hypothetical protein
MDRIMKKMLITMMILAIATLTFSGDTFRLSGNYSWKINSDDPAVNDYGYPGGYSVCGCGFEAGIFMLKNIELRFGMDFAEKISGKTSLLKDPITMEHSFTKVLFGYHINPDGFDVVLIGGIIIGNAEETTPFIIYEMDGTGGIAGIEISAQVLEFVRLGIETDYSFLKANTENGDYNMGGFRFLGKLTFQF